MAEKRKEDTVSLRRVFARRLFGCSPHSDANPIHQAVVNSDDTSGIHSTLPHAPQSWQTDRPPSPAPSYHTVDVLQANRAP